MSNLTEKQLKDTFDLFDADGSGAIDSEELGLVLEGLGFGKLPIEEVEAIVKEVDADASGAIEFEEFKRLCKSRALTSNSKEEMFLAFQSFDHGEKGIITVSDFCQVAESLGEDVRPELYKEIIMEAAGPDVEGISHEDWTSIHIEVLESKRRV
eukprot:TRINITY_DN4489_c0_g2_i1.p1 TRINITY_DN4489_c0_g2~~TRINITY_DN4489_c0_g2_i1.p1  ORF type:complete len:170 (+),score=51.15 TRINITY_DN4489_c0_g2_i1:49-510(+)